MQPLNSSPVSPGAVVESADSDSPARPRLQVRTAWISDLHLGTPGCQAEALLAFLRDLDCQTLYLVGDIIDGWQLHRSWYWPQSHNDVVQKILRKARKGTRVILVPGNHDEFARRYHHAEIRDIDGILYCNDGDWVESLTALVEHHDGRLEIIDRAASARAVVPVRNRAKTSARDRPLAPSPAWRDGSLDDHPTLPGVAWSTGPPMH